MHCEWAVLCDNAYSRSGKTYIAGTFDTIKAKPIPGYKYPTAAVVTRLVGNPDETAFVKVEVCGPGGAPAAQGTGQATMGPQGTSEVVVRLPAIPINDIGLYGIRVSVNGQMKKTINLFVEKLR